MHLVHGIHNECHGDDADDDDDGGTADDDNDSYYVKGLTVDMIIMKIPCFPEIKTVSHINFCSD